MKPKVVLTSFDAKSNDPRKCLVSPAAPTVRYGSLTSAGQPSETCATRIKATRARHPAQLRMQQHAG